MKNRGGGVFGGATPNTELTVTVSATGHQGPGYSLPFHTPGFAGQLAKLIAGVKGRLREIEVAFRRVLVHTEYGINKVSSLLKFDAAFT